MSGSSGRSLLGSFGAMPQPAFLVGLVEAGPAGGSDAVAPAVVLVVGGDIADGLVKPDPVVVLPGPVQLGGQHRGVGDGHQVGMLVFEMAPQRFDPRLVGG